MIPNDHDRFTRFPRSGMAPLRPRAASRQNEKHFTYSNSREARIFRFGRIVPIFTSADRDSKIPENHHPRSVEVISEPPPDTGKLTNPPRPAIPAIMTARRLTNRPTTPFSRPITTLLQRACAHLPFCGAASRRHRHWHTWEQPCLTRDSKNRLPRTPKEGPRTAPGRKSSVPLRRFSPSSSDAPHPPHP